MTASLSTHIWIFLNPQLFLSRFKNFPVHAEGIQIKFARPHASDGIRIHSWLVPRAPSAIKGLQSMCHIACGSGGKLLLLCPHIGLLFSKRLDTILLCHHIQKYDPDSPVHMSIRFVANFFLPLWSVDLKISGFTVKFDGWVWTGAVSGKKKLRIQKDMDTRVDGAYRY